MAYDEKGRPIVDGKPYDEDEHVMDAVLRGLARDPHAVAAAHRARVRAREIKVAQSHSPKSPQSKP